VETPAKALPRDQVRALASDNGNRFLMSAHADRDAAEAAVAAMEAGVQHKQLYYVVERADQNAVSSPDPFL
jgi:hypothetical protein